MLTRLLISSLERAQSPASIRRIIRGLELVTGQSTARLIGAKSVDLGTFSVDDATWYQRHGFWQIAGALGAGYSSYTGTSATPDSVLESSAVYGCVKILSEDMGALDFDFFQLSADHNTETPIYDHSLYPVLHDMPNPDMNAGAFIESIMVGALLCREGFAEIIRDSSGSVMYLIPLEPGTVMRDKNKFGRPIFIYKKNTAQQKIYTADQIFNLPGFSVDGRSGDDILRRARHVFGLTLATQEYPARFFANDASPGIILKRPAGAGEAWGDPVIAAMKKKWREWHQGKARAHEPAILQDGVTAERLDPDHQKLQMIESRKFQVIETCRTFRMKPHKLADLDRATFSNIEHLSIEYARDTLMPWVKRWRQSVHRCLLSPAERAAGYFARHNIEDAMRGDFPSQAIAWTRLQAAGDMSQNEVRRKLHLPPAAGADTLRVQINTEAVAAVIGEILSQREGLPA